MMGIALQAGPEEFAEGLAVGGLDHLKALVEALVVDPSIWSALLFMSGLASV